MEREGQRGVGIGTEVTGAEGSRAREGMGEVKVKEKVKAKKAKKGGGEIIREKGEIMIGGKRSGKTRGMSIKETVAITTIGVRMMGIGIRIQEEIIRIIVQGPEIRAHGGMEIDTGVTKGRRLIIDTDAREISERDQYSLLVGTSIPSRILRQEYIVIYSRYK